MVMQQYLPQGGQQQGQGQGMYPPQQVGGYPQQQQYGQQGGQFAPQYGQPQIEIKWSGLKTGGQYKVPVIAFRGRLADMVYDTQSQYGMRVVEKFDQVQILNSPVPWPWATIEVSIKYSDSEGSAWGRHVASAKNLGLARGAGTVEEAKMELVGKYYEMQQFHESFGEDKDGKAMAGDVWKFISILGQGQGQTGGQTPQAIVQPQIPQYIPQPQMPQYIQPAQMAPQPMVQQQGNPTLAPAVVVTAPIVTGFDTTPAPTDTAAVRAKKLLHGRALNEFLAVALVDPLVKGDSAFVNSIFDQSFIVGLKASGQVQIMPDGKHLVK